MPTAKGADWEKYKKEFADDEVEEKKITPLSDEYVRVNPVVIIILTSIVQGYSGFEDIWRSTLRIGFKKAGEANQGEANERQREDRRQGIRYRACATPSMGRCCR